MGTPRRWAGELVLGALLAAGCTVSGDREGSAPVVRQVDPPPPITATAMATSMGTATAMTTAMTTVTAIGTEAVGVAQASGVATRGPLATNGRPEYRFVTMAFSGDVLVHTQVWGQAAANAGGVGFDFRPMLNPLRVVLEPIDLAVCHLESTIAPVGVPYSTAPRYAVPAEIAVGLADSGYDRCSTASNHTLDQGVPGIDRTVAVLEAAGLGQSGMARTPQESEPRVFGVGDVRVAHLSYTFGFNGNRLPADEPWRSALIDTDRIIADAAEARRRGAEIVILSLHWGAEKDARPTAFQRSVAETLTAAGAANLIVGHHAHVIQPIEQINGTWVAFGLGNLLSNMPGNPSWPASTQDGVLVTVGFVVDESGAVTVERPVAHPTWVSKGEGWLVEPVLEALADPATPPSFLDPMRASLARTRNVIGDFIP